MPVFSTFNGKNLSEGTSFTHSFTVSPSDMDAFANLSGDRNPIHVDPAFAKKAGFSGRVVYGGLIVAAVSRLVGMDLPGEGWIWHSVSMQFNAPLYIDQQAQITATVSYLNLEMGVAQLDVQVTVDARLIARGKAQMGKLSGHSL